VTSYNSSKARNTTQIMLKLITGNSIGQYRRIILKQIFYKRVFRPTGFIDFWIESSMRDLT
jgi:hypothetical protein